VGLLAFDRGRLDLLRVGIGAALDDLRQIHCGDAGAADAMTIIRGACRTLGELCLPRVHDILSSKALTSYRRSAIDRNDAYQLAYANVRERGWEVTTDPVFGPPWSGHRSFDEVLADVRSGELVPMTAPLDANGRAGAHYTSLTFAAERTDVVDTRDTTSNLMKILDFFSDGSPVGWREHHTMTIYYLTNARITSSVHVLTAYDRDEGPETLLDRTTEANVSGYMIIAAESGRAEVNVGIGPGVQDDTQSFPLLSQSSSSYSGVFYPDEPPEFQPISHEARFVNPDRWTFTKSSAPMADRWGTWEL
jgi:hypothetical protein